MRFTRLLLVVLLVLLAGRTAASQDSKPQDNSNAAPRSDYVRPWTGDQAQAPKVSQRGFVEEFKSDENFCYALNTYVMAREDKRSDATRFVAHYTCTPANRFQTKAAVINPQPQQ